jgi:hypothetical protein
MNARTTNLRCCIFSSEGYYNRFDPEWYLNYGHLTCSDPLNLDFTEVDIVSPCPCRVIYNRKLLCHVWQDGKDGSIHHGVIRCENCSEILFSQWHEKEDKRDVFLLQGSLFILSMAITAFLRAAK